MKNLQNRCINSGNTIHQFSALLHPPHHALRRDLSGALQRIGKLSIHSASTGHSSNSEVVESCGMNSALKLPPKQVIRTLFTYHGSTSCNQKNQRIPPPARQVVGCRQTSRLLHNSPVVAYWGRSLIVEPKSKRQKKT